jgi:hypothetical protein
VKEELQIVMNDGDLSAGGTREKVWGRRSEKRKEKRTREEREGFMLQVRLCYVSQGRRKT